jgi:hypothetical protein
MVGPFRSGLCALGGVWVPTFVKPDITVVSNFSPLHCVSKAFIFIFKKGNCQQIGSPLSY